ncbi:hypothetical protein [Roseiconus lacunae]|uniref:Uncharacterized protein n=1 Tax=Roseiconus lacunae TaxID=2605694 RepID=A0ABT7PHD0_9BACT|nr:hypothetical protein [Roseiconus lacunae]MDM4015909.1 hypothetical protein [Roseiconus lacunae]
MSRCNPYSPSALAPIASERIRFRDQHLLLQALLFSMFYFVGFCLLVAVVSGLTEVPQVFAGVLEDFAGIWLPQLIFALIPYVTVRALTIGRFVRPSCWSFCLAGVVTFPFFHFYATALIRDWDAPLIYNVIAHLLSVISAIVIEFLVLAYFGRLVKQCQNAGA